MKEGDDLYDENQNLKANQKENNKKIKDSENIKMVSKKVIELINNFDNILKENNKLKNTNKLLIQNQKNSDLFLKIIKKK